MKRVSFFILAAIFATIGLHTAQAQSVTGSTRSETFTVKPSGDGYEVQLTFTYRFQYCGDQVTLDGYLSSRTALGYWYKGKKYSASETGGFKSGSDVYPNFDFSADVYAGGQNGRIAGGSWSWVNLSSWGGCLGDHGNGGTGLKDKNLVALLYLRNIRAKDSPRRDYGIENAINKKANEEALKKQQEEQQKQAELKKQEEAKKQAEQKKPEEQKKADDERNTKTEQKEIEQGTQQQSGISSSSSLSQNNDRDNGDNDHDSEVKTKTTMTPEQAREAAKAIAQGKRDADRRRNMNSAQVQADIMIQSQRKQAEIRNKAVDNMATTIASAVGQIMQENSDRERAERKRQSEAKKDMEYETNLKIYNKKLEAAQKAAETGTVEGILQLADFFRDVPETFPNKDRFFDHAKAVELYQLAAELGHNESRLTILNLYQRREMLSDEQIEDWRKDGVPVTIDNLKQDQAMADKWMHEAIKYDTTSYKTSHFFSGEAYINKNKTAVLKGYNIARINIGNKYWNGDKSLARDAAEAEKWWNEAMEYDNKTGEPEYLIAQTVSRGKYANEACALSLYDAAARKGYKADYSWAIKRTIEQNDYADYMKWVENVSKIGTHGDSDYSLHSFIRSYLFEIKDKKLKKTYQKIYEPEIVRWAMEGAKKGDHDLMYYLAGYYEDGFGGLKKDAAKAKEWYYKAANAGNSDAMTRIIRDYQ